MPVLDHSTDLAIFAMRVGIMLNSILSDFYERDIRRLIEEITLFGDEGNLWRIRGSVKNSAGNLVLHIVGGLNYLIGATLAQSGYIRDRDREFTQKGVPRKELLDQLDALIPMIRRTLSGLTPEDLNADFPIFFDKPGTSTAYVLIQLLAHLNYHLGQVNYLRRMLE